MQLLSWRLSLFIGRRMENTLVLLDSSYHEVDGEVGG